MSSFQSLQGKEEIFPVYLRTELLTSPYFSLSQLTFNGNIIGKSAATGLYPSAPNNFCYYLPNIKGGENGDRCEVLLREWQASLCLLRVHFGSENNGNML
jgi:hypothetical protein